MVAKTSSWFLRLQQPRNLLASPLALFSCKAREPARLRCFSYFQHPYSAKTAFMRNNRKAWIRIAEAFAAVMIVMAVLLLVISKQTSTENRKEETAKFQAALIEQISKDENLRNQILAGDSSGVEQRISKLAPYYLNYSVNICDAVSACANPMAAYTAGREIYSNEVLIAANLTEYSGRKLKLFFWEK